MKNHFPAFVYEESLFYPVDKKPARPISLNWRLQPPGACCGLGVFLVTLQALWLHDLPKMPRNHATLMRNGVRGSKQHGQPLRSYHLAPFCEQKHDIDR
jgi:hypothetical protein